MMQLCKTTVGKTYRIEKLNLAPDLLHRLQARGICQNASLQVLDRKNTGAVVVRCCASRFALGSYYTTRIAVLEI